MGRLLATEITIMCSTIICNNVLYKMITGRRICTLNSMLNRLTSSDCLSRCTLVTESHIDQFGQHPLWRAGKSGMPKWIMSNKLVFGHSSPYNFTLQNNHYTHLYQKHQNNFNIHKSVLNSSNLEFCGNSSGMHDTSYLYQISIPFNIDRGLLRFAILPSNMQLQTHLYFHRQN